MSTALRWGSAALLALTLAVSTSASAGASRTAWVVGANDGSITRVDLDHGVVTANVATVGALPNRITADSGGTFAVVVCSGSDDLHFLDLSGAGVTRTVALPAGSNPWDAEIAGGRVYVTSLLLDRVDVVDVATGDLLGSVPVGVAPQGMCVAGGKLFVTNTGFDFSTFTWGPGSVSVVDPATLSVVDEIGTGVNPQECVTGPDGRVHVVCTGDFGATQGVIDVIDPATDAVVASLPVPGYPGTAAVLSPLPAVCLGITTTSFSSAIVSYDPFSLAWIHDASDPLLPSFDFYGNVRASRHDELLVADFAADLLLVETPATPGSPAAFLVGDGPIDLAVVESESPVALFLSGLSAVDGIDGVRLTWHATPEAGVAAFAVERQADGDVAERVAAELPAGRDMEFLDRTAPVGPRLTWRVTALGADGAAREDARVALVRRGHAGTRLAIRAVSPNPSRGSARIEWFAPTPGRARLELVDVAGRRVVARELGDVARGEGAFAWDGRGDDGHFVAPGLLLVRLTVDGTVASDRLLRLR